jgi:hypothetical protein
MKSGVLKGFLYNRFTRIALVMVACISQEVRVNEIQNQNQNRALPKPIQEAEPTHGRKLWPPSHAAIVLRYSIDY